MQKCFECSFDISNIRCVDCGYNLCKQCNIKKHFYQKEQQNHNFFLLCEECEVEQRELYCKECDEKLCQICFLNLHRKGNRTTHQKIILEKQELLEIYCVIVIFQVDNFQIIEFQSKNDLQIQNFETYLENNKNQLKYSILLTNLSVNKQKKEFQEIIYNQEPFLEKGFDICLLLLKNLKMKVDSILLLSDFNKSTDYLQLLTKDQEIQPNIIYYNNSNNNQNQKIDQKNKTLIPATSISDKDSIETMEGIFQKENFGIKKSKLIKVSSDDSDQRRIIEKSISKESSLRDCSDDKSGEKIVSDKNQKFDSKEFIKKNTKITSLNTLIQSDQISEQKDSWNELVQIPSNYKLKFNDINEYVQYLVKFSKELNCQMNTDSYLFIRKILEKIDKNNLRNFIEYFQELSNNFDWKKIQLEKVLNYIYDSNNIQVIQSESFEYIQNNQNDLKITHFLKIFYIFVNFKIDLLNECMAFPYNLSLGKISVKSKLSSFGSPKTNNAHQLDPQNLEIVQKILSPEFVIFFSDLIKNNLTENKSLSPENKQQNSLSLKSPPNFNNIRIKSVLKTDSESRLSNLFDTTKIKNQSLDELKHPILHFYNDIDFEDQFSKETALIIQKQLHQLALNGCIKQILDSFVNQIHTQFEITITKIILVIQKAEESNVVYKQLREFSPEHSITFISLKGSFLFSHENFLWIIKSLSQDKISFTFPMIINRVKDVFDLSLTDKFLEDFLDDYIKLKFSLSTVSYRDMFTCLEVKKKYENSVSKFEIFLYEETQQQHKINENSKTHGQLKDLFQFLDFEDSLQISESSNEFTEFQNFIKTTFESNLYLLEKVSRSNQKLKVNQTFNQENDSNPLDAPFYSKDSESKNSIGNNNSISQSLRKKILVEEFEDELSESQKYSKQFQLNNCNMEKKINNLSVSAQDNNVMSCLTHNQYLKGDSEDKLKKHQINKRNEEDEKRIKAIPGGKYGLALFTKYFGPKYFSDFSMGKIISIIDKALRVGLLKYTRTFIIFNNDYEMFKNFRGNRQLLETNKVDYKNQNKQSLSNPDHEINKIENIIVNESESHELLQKLLKDFVKALTEVFESHVSINICQVRELMEIKSGRNFKILETFGILKIRHFLDLYNDIFEVNEEKKGAVFVTMKKIEKQKKLLPKKKLKLSDRNIFYPEQQNTNQTLQKNNNNQILTNSDMNQNSGSKLNRFKNYKFKNENEQQIKEIMQKDKIIESEQNNIKYQESEQIQQNKNEQNEEIPNESCKDIDQEFQLRTDLNKSKRKSKFFKTSLSQSEGLGLQKNFLENSMEKNMGRIKENSNEGQKIYRNLTVHVKKDNKESKIDDVNKKMRNLREMDNEFVNIGQVGFDQEKKLVSQKSQPEPSYYCKKVPVESLKEISFKQNLSISKKKTKLNNSSIDGYLYKIRVIIFQLLNKCKTGIELGQLQKKLNQIISSNFDCFAFGYENFYSFLLDQMKNFVEVEVKYLSKHEIRYIIYLKNKKFGFNNKNKYLFPKQSKPIEGELKTEVEKRNCNSSQKNQLVPQNYLKQLFSQRPFSKEVRRSVASNDFNFSSNYISKLKHSNVLSGEEAFIYNKNHNISREELFSFHSQQLLSQIAHFKVDEMNSYNDVEDYRNIVENLLEPGMRGFSHLSSINCQDYSSFLANLSLKKTFYPLKKSDDFNGRDRKQVEFDEKIKQEEENARLEDSNFRQLSKQQYEMEEEKDNEQIDQKMNKDEDEQKIRLQDEILRDNIKKIIFEDGFDNQCNQFSNEQFSFYF